LFNKWYGRAAGDELLITIGTYLKSLKTKYGFVSGYFGGDDFVIVMDDDDTLIGELTAEITNAVSQYGSKTEFHPVFGAYKIANKSDSMENMYECAKTALKHALGHYKATFCWYNKNLGDTDEEELILVTKVQKALENEEFVFYSQPKCSLKDGKIVGAEALVRWNSKEDGLVSPGKFIPTLERNGFITNLDRYLWEKVCIQLRKWIDAGIKPVPISVNVSRMDIYAMDVPAFFRNLTHKYNLDKKLIELEITETAYVEEFAIVKDAIKELRDAGFKVLIDDFGSGYSSLNMLKDINVDLLKLDMKFLDIGENNRIKGVGILESVVDLAHSMKLPVIAEGVETENQADALRNIGCGYAQGYLFYKPLPIEEFEKLLMKEEDMDYDGIVVNY